MGSNPVTDLVPKPRVGSKVSSKSVVVKNVPFYRDTNVVAPAELPFTAPGDTTIEVRSVNWGHLCGNCRKKFVKG